MNRNTPFNWKKSSRYYQPTLTEMLAVLQSLKTLMVNLDKEMQQVQVLQEKLMDLLTGQPRTQFSPQDMVYSMGLTDYLQDKIVLRLLNAIYSILSPGGKVILGNY